MSSKYLPQTKMSHNTVIPKSEIKMVSGNHVKSVLVRTLKKSKKRFKPRRTFFEHDIRNNKQQNINKNINQCNLDTKIVTKSSAHMDNELFSSTSRSHAPNKPSSAINQSQQFGGNKLRKRILKNKQKFKQLMAARLNNQNTCCCHCNCSRTGHTSIGLNSFSTLVGINERLHSTIRYNRIISQKFH